MPPLSLSTSMPAFPSQSLPRLHPYSLGLSWAAWEAPGSLATVWYSLCKTDSPTSLQGQLYTTSPESLRTDLQLKLCQSHSMGPKPPLTPSQLSPATRPPGRRAQDTRTPEGRLIVTSAHTQNLRVGQEHVADRAFSYLCARMQLHPGSLPQPRLQP